MKVGLQLPSFSFPGWPASIGPTLVEIAQAAEAGGLASLWLMDHLFQLPPDTGWGGPDEPMLEAYTTLGFLARSTSTIELGPMVAGIVHRHPGVLIKTATTLDVLSGGRSWFAVGASWYEREAHGLGVPYPPRRERFDLLEDTLQLAHRMWADDRRPFEGRTIRLDEPINVPPPVARPRPRIMVGGGGERRTLRLVARYADACNILVPDPGESRRKIEVLKRHCDEIGRPFEEIETTSLVEIDLRPGRMIARDVVDALSVQAAEGIAHVIVNLPEVHDLGHLDVLRREVVPAVADLSAA
ncbi:MAG TPA: TIGR03560 family F420-dependent LLM class oxidoreductase [Candidatus Limnocylindrales bacterium]|jgi:F420-dependent oxidoreductase-like protein